MELQDVTSQTPLLKTKASTESSVFKACRSGDWKSVFFEIDNNAKTIQYFFAQNECDDQKTILHYMCNLEESEDDLATELVEKYFGRIEEYLDKSEDLEELVNLQTLELEYSPLHFAIEKRHKKVVEYLILNSADVNLRAKSGKKDALGLIYDRLHILMPRLYDKGYQVIKDKWDPSNKLLWKLSCDFTSIIGICSGATLNKSPNESFREATLLTGVLQQKNIKRTPILLHPLVQIFLYGKGKKMQNLIRLSIFYHIAWSLLVSFYIGCNFGELEEIKEGNESSAEDVENENSIGRQGTCFGGPYTTYNSETGFTAKPHFYTIFVIWYFTLLKELYEFAISPSWRFYVSQFQNWGQIVVLMAVPLSTALALLIQKQEGNDIGTSRSLREAVFLINTVGISIALLLIQGQSTKSETLGIYNEMLVKVFLRFLNFFFAFLPKLLAFLVLFYRLLPKQEQLFHHEWGLGINKILSMMTGELNYDDLFPGDGEERLIYWVPSKIVFFFFVVSVTIVLQNLLLGLTISDIDKLKKKALVRHLAARLEMIYLIEKFVTNDIVVKMFSRFGYTKLLSTYLVGSSSDEDMTDAKQDKVYDIVKLPKKMRKFITDYHAS